MSDSQLPGLLILDVDGTILPHMGSITSIAAAAGKILTPLPGVLDKINEAKEKGYFILITTARPKSLKKLTKLQLHAARIVYDAIVFGVGRGIRIICNDMTTDGKERAKAYNLVRDEGLSKVEL